MSTISVCNQFPVLCEKTEVLQNGEDFFLFLHPRMKEKRIDFVQPDYYSFIVVRSGCIKITTDGILYLVTESSSMAVLPRQHVVAEVLDENADCIVYLLSSSFASKLMVQNEYIIYSALNKNPVLHYSPEEMRVMDDLVQLQRDVLRHPIASQLLDINAMLLHINFRLVSLGRLRETNMEASGCNRYEMMMMRFTQPLDRYYLQERRIAWYASELCVAPKYLSECAKRATGHTAGWWIDHYLMRDAVRMLRQKRLSVKTIAFRLGFEDPSTFGKWFKRLKGLSPAHYRQDEGK